MIDPASLESLRTELSERIAADQALLETLRAEIRPLKDAIRRIQPRTTTAISLVGTDGGNNRLEFDPFMAQLVRVVDSSQNEYCLEAITPTTDIHQLSKRHFMPDGHGKTPLGRMMSYLGKKYLWEISPMIPEPPQPEFPKPSWVQVYRELTEWAVLFSLVREKDFGTDTVIVMDGFLRSKVFAGDLFLKLRQGIEEGIEKQFAKNRRRLYLAGVSKHSKVLQRYRLAMAIEAILRQEYPCYVEISRDIERKAYVWAEYARGDEADTPGGEVNKFVAGKMFFVKFGRRPHDPIWPIDILIAQIPDAQKILGFLLADAIEGFPVPFYPLCLQRAHENAALVDFDMDILQREIVDAIRKTLPDNGQILDELRLQDEDPSQRRYW
jgi:hypothetical protein